MASAGTPTAPRQRPLAVSIAAWLLGGVAVVQLAGVALGASILGEERRVLDSLYAHATDGKSIVSTRMNLTLASLGIGAALAVAFAVLGLLVRRRNRPARKATFWLGIMYLCCTGYGALLNGASSGIAKNSAANGGPDPEEAARRLGEVGPAWYPEVSLVLATISMIWVLAAVLLLAVPPPSKEYFRKHVIEPDPPTPPKSPASPKTPASGKAAESGDGTPEGAGG